MGVTANKPGVCTTVQDAGRFGYLGSGFSPSGVMDRRAFRIANLLVDNPENAPVLEFCLAGPTLRFTAPTFIALTGGDFGATIDGAPVPLYTALQVRRGSVLALNASRTGVYGYLAVAGGSFKIGPVMGSTSTNLKCRIGGWHGRKLEAGDYLPFATPAVDYLPNLASHAVEDANAFYEFNADTVRLRVVPGPQEDLFTEEGIETFYGSPFTVTGKCDRMGFRLDGDVVRTRHGSDIVSDGIALGAVQVPDHGRPIIMLADRQTTGGYAKIGTVATVDIPKLVQSRPGRTIRFERISVQEAQALLHDDEVRMCALAKMVKRPCFGGLSPRKTARRLTPILEAQAIAAEHEQLWVETGDHLHAERIPEIMERRERATQAPARTE
ncbi:MAG: biotin-dependent carboxyltransferase family protein [Denitrobacterium sp.]|nr:biotin-dependent carboxyltransferase family protein [Denitrobacterium sp.]